MRRGGWQWKVVSAIAIGIASLANGNAEPRCIEPGLPFADDPTPQLLRAGRAQLDAYLACMQPELDRLRHEARSQDVATKDRDAIFANVDRIVERWRNYEERMRARRPHVR